MEIPTVMVRRLDVGDECLINTSDFDPQLHEKLSGAEESPSEPAQKSKRVKKG